MRKILALVIPAVFLFAACGTSVEAGVVTDKNYKEAYQTEEEVMERDCDTEYRTKTYRDSKGKTQTKKEKYQDCEMEGTGEYETIDHAAEYTLTLRDDEDNTGTVEVSESEYNSVEVGDFFDGTD